MFREMRRKDRQLSQEQAFEILRSTQEGVLGTISENGYPYTCFLNYVMVDDKIYFHTAKVGHKIDNIKANSKVSFSVCMEREVVQETFTTNYKSVTCFGDAMIIEPSKQILMEIIKKFSPDFLESGQEYVNKDYMSTGIVEITIEHITGKEHI